LAITTGALLVLLAAVPTAGIALQAIVVTVASMIASALRFVLLPAWVFRDPPAHPSTDPPSTTAR
jgi:hypothetical protein